MNALDYVTGAEPADDVVVPEMLGHLVAMGQVDESSADAWDGTNRSFNAMAMAGSYGSGYGRYADSGLGDASWAGPSGSMAAGFDALGDGFGRAGSSSGAGVWS